MQTNTQTENTVQATKMVVVKDIAPVKPTKVYVSPEGDRLYTAADVMAEVGFKYRALLDKCIQMGVISPIKKPGRQPATYQGRRFLFRQEQVDKLKKYVEKQKEGKLPRRPRGSLKAAQTVKNATFGAENQVTLANPADIMAQLSAAIQQVEQLKSIVLELRDIAQSERKSSTP